MPKLRAGLISDLRSQDRGLVRHAVHAVVQDALGGRRAHAGLVAAWASLALACLYSETGTSRRGVTELARRAGWSESTVKRTRKQLMPPEGVGAEAKQPHPSLAGLLLRPKRGRSGEGVSLWALGNGLLYQVRARVRAALDDHREDRSRRSSHGVKKVHVAAPPTAGRPEEHPPPPAAAPALHQDDDSKPDQPDQPDQPDISGPGSVSLGDSTAAVEWAALRASLSRRPDRGRSGRDQRAFDRAFG